MSGANRAGQRRWVSWVVLVVVVVTFLAMGSASPGRPSSPGARARALAEEIACPQCAGESVAQSSAPAAVNIYREIERQIDAGRSDDDIRSYLAQQFGEDVLLRPSASGPAAYVWAVPVVVAVLGAAGLVVAFRRWRRVGPLAPSDEDRALVASYLEGGGAAGDDDEEGSGR